MERKKKSPSRKKREMSLQEKFDRETRIMAIVSIVIGALGIVMTVLRLLLQ